LNSLIAVAPPLIANLAGNEHVFAKSLYDLAQHLLISSMLVEIGCIEKIDAQVNGRVQ